MKSEKLGLVITTGDADGIGFEVSAKALLALGPQKGFTFYLFHSDDWQNRNDIVYIKKILSRFRVVTVNSLKAALVLPRNNYDLIEIVSTASPAVWVRDAAKLCAAGKLDGITTAPLSKIEIKNSGIKAIGHTEILQKAAHAKHVFMAFRGSKMNVVLATGHVGIKRVKITPMVLNAAVSAADRFRKFLPDKVRKLPIGVVALNPHSGERGIIGNEEVRSYVPTLKKLSRRGLKIEGPLVPDVVFAKERWKKYSVLVASYHDQGLIPFKLLHGFSDPGVHLTLGIPFVRTSVDHGTAKDIFGQNKANPRSMIAAIKLAVALIERR